MITTQGNDDGQLKQYIQRGDPQLKEVLLGFLDSASSLCDMMSTIMAAVLNEIMSIQANEACGAEGATR
ncbi:MAG: hypothetical protein DUD39_15715, partial [Coriobacteriaceae bacterium]